MHKQQKGTSYLSSVMSFFSQRSAEPKLRSKRNDPRHQALYNCVQEVVSEQPFLQGSPMCELEIKAVQQKAVAEQCKPCSARVAPK